MQSKYTQERLFPARNVTPTHIPAQGPTDIPATYLLLNKISNYNVPELFCSYWDLSRWRSYLMNILSSEKYEIFYFLLFKYCSVFYYDTVLRLFIPSHSGSLGFIFVQQSRFFSSPFVPGSSPSVSSSEKCEILEGLVV